MSNYLPNQTKRLWDSVRSIPIQQLYIPSGDRQLSVPSGDRQLPAPSGDRQLPAPSGDRQLSAPSVDIRRSKRGHLSHRLYFWT